MVSSSMPATTTASSPPTTRASLSHHHNQHHHHHHAAITSTTPSPTKGKMRVSDYVTAQFARFEQEYGPSVLVEVDGGDEKIIMRSDKNSNNNNNNNNSNNSIRNKNQGNNHAQDISNNNNNNNNTHHHQEEPFLLLLFTLYLPLFLLGIRRTTFGTAHILFHFARSLIIGHLLRLLLSMVLLSVPPSWVEMTSVHFGRVWNGIRGRVVRVKEGLCSGGGGGVGGRAIKGNEAAAAAAVGVMGKKKRIIKGKVDQVMGWAERIWWGRITRMNWVKHVMWALTGDGRYFPHCGEKGRFHYHQHHQNQNLQQYYENGSNGESSVDEGSSHHYCNSHGANHPSPSGSGTVGYNSTSSGSGSGPGLSNNVTANSPSISGNGMSVSSRRGLNPDNVWPPPALTLLTLMTVVAFVVHPDGLTWIMLGKLIDGSLYTLQIITLGLTMMKGYGTIPTLAASAVLAALILFFGIIHKTLSPKRPKHLQNRQGGDLAGDGSSSTSSFTGNNNSHNSRKKNKGKKGRNGRHGHHSHASRGRGKVRGGQNNNNFRPTKDLCELPERNESRSESPSTTKNSGDENDSHHESNESVPKEIVDSIHHHHHRSNNIDDGVKETINGGSLKQRQTQSQSQQQSQDNHISKNRPYSIDSTSVPQLSDDVSSCSSIAGSFSDMPSNAKLYKGTGDYGERSSSTITESGGNRRKKRGGKRGKGQAPSTGLPNNVSVGGPNNSNNNASNTSSTSVNPFPRHARIPAPPGFVAKDPSMTPSRISPLPISSATTSPVRSMAPSPLPKPIGRPIHTAPRTMGNSVPITRDDSLFHSFGHDLAPGSRPSHPALRNRTSSDGVVKFGSPTNIAPIGSSLPSQSLLQPPGIVRYGFPNYAAYAQNDHRYAPGKIELAAFLAQVGLVGSACADLLADLFDVDALAALTSDQFYSYKIGREKQLEIKALLEARRSRLQQQQHAQTQHKSTTVSGAMPLRPPPGLGFKPDGLNGIMSSPGSGLTSSGASAAVVSNPTASPLRPLPQAAPVFVSDNNNPATNNFLLPSTSINQTGSNITLPSLTNTESSFLGSSDPIIKPLDGNTSIARPFSINPSPFSRLRVVEPETDDDKIDADLQQLGDRMVGSILDF